MIRREPHCHAHRAQGIPRRDPLQRLSHVALGGSALSFIRRSDQNYAIAQADASYRKNLLMMHDRIEHSRQSGRRVALSERNPLLVSWL